MCHFRKQDRRLGQYDPLARSLADKYARRFKGLVDPDDLISVARESLWVATQTCKDVPGFTFGVYARKAIVHDLLDLWRRSTALRRDVRLIAFSLDDEDHVDSAPRNWSFQQDVLLEQKRTLEKLQGAMTMLGPDELAVVECLYSDADPTTREIAKLLGWGSHKRVLRAEARALETLRSAFVEPCVAFQVTASQIGVALGWTTTRARKFLKRNGVGCRTSSGEWGVTVSELKIKLGWMLNGVRGLRMSRDELRERLESLAQNSALGKAAA